MVARKAVFHRMRCPRGRPRLPARLVASRTCAGTNMEAAGRALRGRTAWTIRNGREDEPADKPAVDAEEIHKPERRRKTPPTSLYAMHRKPSPPSLRGS